MDFYRLIGIRKFKVGDCLVSGSSKPEPWEIYEPSYIIVEIGHNHYRASFKGSRTIFTNIKFGHIDEGFYNKVECNGMVYRD